MVAVLAAMLLPANTGGPRKAQRISCVNNLKQVGLAYRLWAGDNDNKYPMEVSVTNGGTMELIADGKNAWLNFLVMSNELSTPKILICPADAERFPPATNFTSELAWKISYFVGLDADEDHPQMFLSGDGNFAISNVPVKSGVLELSTNMAAYWLDVPVDWTDTRHKPRLGNIGFADGSARETYFYSLRNALYQTGVATNRLAIP